VVRWCVECRLRSILIPKARNRITTGLDSPLSYGGLGLHPAGIISFRADRGKRGDGEAGNHFTPRLWNIFAVA